MRKKAILVVSFGTSYQENIQKTIGAVEESLRQAFPDYPLFRAFTSPTIRRKLWEKEKIEVKSPEEMLRTLKQEGYEAVLVQPTFVLRGFEYERLKECVEKFQREFDQLRLGTPLLYEESDIKALGEALCALVEQEEESKETEWIFVGHGTEHEADEVYQSLQSYFRKKQNPKIWIGTVEGSVGIAELARSLKEQEVCQKKTDTQVRLHPLLLVAGEHANNDIAGDEEDSWKSTLQREGFLVSCCLRGLGEYPQIQKLYQEKVSRLLA
ncbi:MAG: sirohydrochlorin cobaltochelatase [bacterium]|nr:sirohydrochlorin cobaltochelatase [bacterium]